MNRKIELRTGIRRAAAMCATGLMFALAAPAAHAQSKDDIASAIRAHCVSDVKSICSSVMRAGGEQVLACLQKNMGGLSAACKPVIEGTIAASAPPAAPAAPPPPVTTAPPQSPPPAAATPPAAPDPAPTPPPTKPAEKAAPAPKAASAPAEPEPKAAEPAPAEPAPSVAPTTIEAAILAKQCLLDIRVHCANVPAGEGRVLACLQSVQDRLTPRCRLTVGAVAR
jgi:outer membrane biosynthesis protein TonB